MEELCKKIEDTIKKLKIGNDFEEYDSLEFDLLELNSQISTLEYDYEKVKLENSLEWNTEFNLRRGKEKSDASTERIVAELLKEKTFTEKSQKNLVEKYNKLQKGYIRIADHVKGKFIREMADAKRQQVVENRQF